MIDESKTLQIKKEVLLRVPRQRVWDALTTVEGWTGWFSDDVQGEFRVGETLTLDFGKCGKCWAIVVERDELNAFACKWHPGEDCALDKYPAEQMTTVRFELTDHLDGTLLKLTESGFENVPEERRANCLKLNSSGWDWELDELRAWLEEGVRQSRAGTE